MADQGWLKAETWDSSKSRFETESTWPELKYWTSYNNPVFIIPDYINPYCEIETKQIKEQIKETAFSTAYVLH